MLFFQFLLDAISKKDVKKVERLLAQLKDVNDQNKYRKMALYYAVKDGCTEIIASLLSHEKINVDADDKYGKTALYYAVEKGYTEIVELLLKHEEEIDVNTKYHPGKTEPHGETVLILAAYMGYQEIVKLLLSNEGVNVNARTLSERTALHVAAEEGHAGIVELLLKRGADTNIRNLDGKTALHIAAEKNHIEIVELLLDREGIDINAKDCYGNTALYLAANSSYKEVVKLLLKHRVNFEDENVALRYAVINNHKEIMCLLLIYGASLDEDSENEINKKPKLKECLIMLKEVKKMPNLGKLMEMNKNIEESTDVIFGFINDEDKKQELIREFETIKKRHPYERLFFILEYLLDFIKHIFLKFFTSKKVMATQLHESKDDIKVTTKDGTVLKNLPYEAAEKIVSYFDADTNKAVSLILSKRVDAFLTKLKKAVPEIPGSLTKVEVVAGSIKPSTECCVV